MNNSDIDEEKKCTPARIRAAQYFTYVYCFYSVGMNATCKRAIQWNDGARDRNASIVAESRNMVARECVEICWIIRENEKQPSLPGTFSICFLVAGSLHWSGFYSVSKGVRCVLSPPSLLRATDDDDDRRKKILTRMSKYNHYLLALALRCEGFVVCVRDKYFVCALNMGMHNVISDIFVCIASLPYRVHEARTLYLHLIKCSKRKREDNIPLAKGYQPNTPCHTTPRKHCVLHIFPRATDKIISTVVIITVTHIPDSSTVFFSQVLGERIDGTLHTFQKMYEK